MGQTDVPAPGSGSVDRAGAPPAAPPARMVSVAALIGRLRKTVLTIHVAAAVSLLGASAVLLVGGLWAATRDEPADDHLGRRSGMVRIRRATSAGSSICT